MDNGPLRTQEVWYRDGQKLETTFKYKYLGICFTKGISWWTAQHIGTSSQQGTATIDGFHWQNQVANQQIALPF
jgi:hypothetical protein